MSARIATAACCLGLLSYSWSFTAPYAIPKLGVLAVGAFLSVWAWNGEVGPLGVPALVMLWVCLMSAVFARDGYLAIVGRYNSYAMGLMGLSIAFLLYLGASRGDEKGLEAIAACGAVVGLHAFAQWMGIDSALSSQITGNRAIGTMGSPVDLGMVLACALPLSLSRSPYFGAAVVLGIIATGSRGALLAGSAGILAWKVRP